MCQLFGSCFVRRVMRIWTNQRMMTIGSTCLNFEIVRYIKIPTTEAIESNDLNMENWLNYYFDDT